MLNRRARRERKGEKGIQPLGFLGDLAVQHLFYAIATKKAVATTVTTAFIIDTGRAS